MIGIDVSKSWLDAHVLLKGRVEERALRVKNSEVVFSNSSNG